MPLAGERPSMPWVKVLDLEGESQVFATHRYSPFGKAFSLIKTSLVRPQPDARVTDLRMHTAPATQP
jgi:hypothetical protein